MAGSLNQTQYAKHRGVSKMAVSKAVKAGRIQVDENGLIDPEVADRLWSSRTTPQAPASKPKEGPAPGGATADDYFTHRAERERWAAMREQLDYEKAAKALLPAAEVRQTWGSFLRGLQQALMGYPDRVAEDLDGLSLAERRQVLRREMIATLRGVVAEIQTVGEVAE